MKILAEVGSDLSENREMSKGQGFLGTNNQPRVSRYLSHALTEYGDGQQVNIPALTIFVKFLNSFRISRASRDVVKEKLMDCNDEKFLNLHVSADSRSQ